MSRPVIVRIAPVISGVTLVIIWSGSIATIPAGFKLCDGTGGTLDMRDRFVKGYYPIYSSVGETGGADTVDFRHTHDGSGLTCGTSSHSHNWWANSGVPLTTANGYQGVDVLAALAQHVHPISGSIGTESAHTHYVGGVNGNGGTTPSAGSATQDNRPPWYALAYIQGSTDVPTGCIALYPGDPAALPTGYALCDGSGGTPDMTDCYLVAAGGTYAVDSYEGSYYGATHNHALTSGIGVGPSGAHDHRAPSSATSGLPDVTVNAASGAWTDQLSPANHIHAAPGTLVDGAHSHTISGTMTAAGPRPSTDPRYIVLAWIIKL